jgi:benzylsuccinate CoA-transferase BbsF subunit
LSGVRVLDFSWVIAGPTTTRYLAAMGAEVIKVEAPGKGDPARGTGLHTVLGQGKQGIVLDLKKPEAVEIARLLAAKSDVLIENFATGVMDRLGLGAEALKAVNPNLLYISASGMGRTGPDAHAVAYGTLLQSYAGFAGLNRHPHVRVDARVRDRGSALAPEPDRGGRAHRLLHARSDALDHGRAVARNTTRPATAAGRQ